MFDIDHTMYHLREMATEEDLYFGTNMMISAARLAYEESLKITSVTEEQYIVLADKIDDLILSMNSVFAFPPAKGRMCMALFQRLLEELLRIDYRLKTIDVLCERPRPRNKWIKPQSSMWVDANGYRVRDPKLAVNVPKYMQGYSPSPAKPVIPNAPVKAPAQCAAMRAITPTNLQNMFEAEACDDKRYLKRVELNIATGPEYPPNYWSNRQVESREKDESREHFKTFVLAIQSQLDHLTYVKSVAKTQSGRFVNQCEAYCELFGYMRDNIDYIKSEPKLNSAKPTAFVPTVIRKCKDLIGQIEQMYATIRRSSKRIDPHVRATKCESTKTLQQVYDAMVSI